MRGESWKKGRRKKQEGKKKREVGCHMKKKKMQKRGRKNGTRVGRSVSWKRTNEKKERWEKRRRGKEERGKGTIKSWESLGKRSGRSLRDAEKVLEKTVNNRAGESVLVHPRSHCVGVWSMIKDFSEQPEQLYFNGKHNYHQATVLYAWCNAIANDMISSQ